jgi:hypothetical protein
MLPNTTEILRQKALGVGPYAPQDEGAPVVPGRAVKTLTTSSLDNNATFTGAIELAKTFTLNSISLSSQSRLRIYQTAAQLTADLSRPSITAPLGQHGLIAEFIGSGAMQAQSGVIGTNQELVPSDLIPFSITNLSGAAASITIEVNYLPLES